MTGIVVLGSLIGSGLAVLQSTVMRFIAIAGVQPDLVLIMVVFIANKNGSMAGQLVGLVAGVILDVMGLAPLGFHALVFTVIGFAYGMTRGKMFVDPVFMPVLLVLVAEIMKGALAALIAALYSLDAVTARLFSPTFLIEAGYTSILGPVLFAVLTLLPFLQPDRRKGEVV